MLLENNNTFRIGDLVKITATGQIGKIVAFESGRWKVQVENSDTLLMESGNLERRQALFG